MRCAVLATKRVCTSAVRTRCAQFSSIRDDCLEGASAACVSAGIDAIGIVGPATVHKNLTYDELRAHEQKGREGVVTAHGGCFAVDTGRFTGRSPKDKYIVRRQGSESDGNIWWGDVNQPMKPEVFDELFTRAVDHFNGRDNCYVYDGFVGASPDSRRRVRFVHELAWQQHFVKNMFIDLDDGVGGHGDDSGAEPDFTVINACALTNEKWREHGLNSEVAVAIDVERKLAVIMGTWYGGENKKGLFSMMNYWLPLEGKLPMHCSASLAKDTAESDEAADESGRRPGKNAALFFGLSGTGKTTISTDPNRKLIGDDEHGWDDDGVFNFEGGCYAKTIDLSEANEPDIFGAIKGPAGLLENVQVDGITGVPDYYDSTKTANGRVSYPLWHIENHEPSGTSRGAHPENVVFLTCDAFGVLPPVAKLTTEQAMYQFISGYTAKVAGTELGVTAPQATFSACFGAAFLTLHPLRYAALLREKLEAHGSTAWLVNTGWAGGGADSSNANGKPASRMPIAATRSCVDAILDGSLAALAEMEGANQSAATSSGASDFFFETDPVFGFQVPKSLGPGVSCDHVPLLPREAWTDPLEYDAARLSLAELFQANFEKYDPDGSTGLAEHGPQILK